jgi:carbonic anhydrase
MAFRQAWIAAALLLFVVPTPAPGAQKNSAPAEWSYSGDSGPANWGRLSREYASCRKGRSQSPVDLKWTNPLGSRKIEFDYRSVRYRVIDTGHTVQVNFEPGNRIRISGKSYELEEMHFHSASEHSLSGTSYPLEVQLVHRSAAGKLAIVAAVFKPGGLNLPLGKVWAGIPSDKGREAIGEGKFNPAAFLPGVRTHYHYLGSLTTPPCTEGVDWSVLNTPLEASPEQIERFRRIYAGNSRPIQPLHGRRPANY